ncbi:MAG: hypothetical protein A2499_17785 [Stygiobacter sp. RIFOXYC12_FULL_38_8]|nr:MAG: hypothetical protein A2299_03990 [Stygiobacter sp. RIFOXYB2_FULL_37_11]OGV12379.1 MAG: hypothetical protein A2440_14065 [Stygiobacter sp. RIFOXYC2_FULL_38_25]OGV25248.1 MAG: hypothetical protein A2499_17785 [Stygiobacter sp. RIFOXYC12_FULL_38_8]OGV83069.1 MAG: hypothetical protein A2X65_11310 [Stygiobacter sp. GWF2_38_21]RJQ62875.1 MAG: T9SS C-terminal target domain-containing protein [Stygiobacter sp.]
MKKALLILFFICTLIQAQQSTQNLSELWIHVLYVGGGNQLNFEATISSASHWDFQNNLVTNNDYTYQQEIVQPSDPNARFNFKDTYTNGMSKGLYNITVKNSNGTILASFAYDLRTSKDYLGSSPDLEVNYYANTSEFRLTETDVVIEGYVNSWDEVPELAPYQQTDLFEPQAPTNLFVYSNGGHPQLNWNNNYQEDYWTMVDVYRGEVYSGYPTSFSLIASLNSNATSYYDTRYSTGSGAMAYYKVCKRNNQRNSAFSNVVNISIIPHKVTEGNNESNKLNKNEKHENLLFQNYPNPFNPSTEITFQLAENSNIHLEIFDVLGRKVVTLAEGHFGKGLHRMNFDASKIPSGIYYYRLIIGNISYCKKMLITK